MEVSENPAPSASMTTMDSQPCIVWSNRELVNDFSSSLLMLADRSASVYHRPVARGARSAAGQDLKTPLISTRARRWPRPCGDRPRRAPAAAVGADGRAWWRQTAAGAPRGRDVAIRVRAPGRGCAPHALVASRALAPAPPSAPG